MTKIQKLKILVLAANPVDTNTLKFTEEIKAIENELLTSRLLDSFELHQKHVVKSENLSEHLLQIDPDVVHFVGQEPNSGRLFLENSMGKIYPLSSTGLSELFSSLKQNVSCVILSACYSEVQANSIAKHIDCVIGTPLGMGDDASIKFIQGFYRGIGLGKDVLTAYKLGCNQIDVENLEEQQRPKILWKKEQLKNFCFFQKNQLQTKPKNDSVETKKTTIIKPKNIQLRNTSLNSEGYERVFDFACSSSGLCLSESSAKLFTEEWIKENHDCDFNQFIRIFNYAIAPNGKNLNRSAAIKYAIVEINKQKRK